jgi:hypothetical protein
MFERKPLANFAVECLDDNRFIGGETDQETKTIRVQCEGTYKDGVIKYHEQLHATYDTVELSLEEFKLVKKLGVSDDAYGAVGDARVQLVYWEKGRDESLDRDAVQVGIDDLMSVARSGLGINGLLIQLRSLAIIEHLGTREDKQKAYALVQDSVKGSDKFKNGLVLLHLTILAAIKAEKLEVALLLMDGAMRADGEILQGYSIAEGYAQPG